MSLRVVSRARFGRARVSGVLGARLRARCGRFRARFGRVWGAFRARLRARLWARMRARFGRAFRWSVFCGRGCFHAIQLEILVRMVHVPSLDVSRAPQTQNTPRTTPERPQNTPRTPQNASERWRKRVLVVAWNIWTQELTRTTNFLFSGSGHPCLLLALTVLAVLSIRKIEKNIDFRAQKWEPKNNARMHPSLMSFTVAAYIYIYIHMYIYICMCLFIHPHAYTHTSMYVLNIYTFMLGVAHL